MENNKNIFSSQVLASKKHKGGGDPLSNPQRKNIPSSPEPLAPGPGIQGAAATRGSNPGPGVPAPPPSPPTLAR